MHFLQNHHCMDELRYTRYCQFLFYPMFMVLMDGMSELIFVKKINTQINHSNSSKKKSIMKKIQTILAIGTFFLFAIISCSSAQEFMKTDAKIVKVLADTTYMTAMEVTFPAGYKTNTHSHPAHFVYALTDGTLNIAYSDGKKEEFSMKAGDSFSAAPERPHMTTNAGNKPLTFILVELKDHPYKASMKK